jgi:hypothetical protein
MAVIFELLVNFGTNTEAAGTAAELVRRFGHIDVREVPVPLGRPFVSELPRPHPYIDGVVVAGRLVAAVTGGRGHSL